MLLPYVVLFQNAQITVISNVQMNTFQSQYMTIQ